MKGLLKELLLKMPWQSGRQETGYQKLEIWISKRFKFDIHLLRYPVGSYVPQHIDPTLFDAFEHHRINIILRPAIRGGKFILKGKSQEGRIHRFRPDKYTHNVTEIKEGTRYVLSFGRLKKVL